MKIDADAREVRFFSLFEKRLVPVDLARGEKIITVVDFFLKRRLEPHDKLGLDFPLKGKTYRLEAGVAGRGTLKLPAWPQEAFPCARIEGTITGWGGERQTKIDAYVGSKGELAGKILSISFKFTDWPRVTLTLCALAAK